MDIMSIVASIEEEPSMFDGFVGIILGGFVSFIVMWFSMLLLGVKIRFLPDSNWAKEAKKYNEELVKRRPWIVWLVFIATLGSAAGTFLWYCGGKLPPIN